MRFIPKYCHHLSLVTCLAFLSYYHIKGMMLRDMESAHVMLDVGMIYMIMVQKLSSLAYNYHDGKYYKDHDFLQKAHPKGAVKNKAVFELPQYLQVLSYSYNFFGIMGGPMIFFKDYLEGIEGGYGKETVKGGSNTKAATKKFLKSLCFLVLVDRLETKFGNSSLITKRAWVEQASLQTKLLLPSAFLMIQRYKYYFFWLLAESINNFAGIGYNKNEDNWDLISNNNIFKVEFAQNTQQMINNWNMGTARWLRLIVFERVPKNFKFLAVPGTFLLSAVWHGFWPGQYVFFVLTNFTLMAYKNLNKSIIPWLEYKTNNNRKIIDLVYFWGSLLQHIVFNLNGICFTILQTWDRTVFYYRACYYIPQILSLMGALIPWKKVLFVPKDAKDRAEKKKL